MINKHLQEQVTNYLSIDMRQDAVREYYLNLFIISFFVCSSRSSRPAGTVESDLARRNDIEEIPALQRVSFSSVHIQAVPRIPGSVLQSRQALGPSMENSASIYLYIYIYI